MTSHAISYLTTHKIVSDPKESLDIEFSVFREIVEQDKCIEFECGPSKNNSPIY